MVPLKRQVAAAEAQAERKELEEKKTRAAAAAKLGEIELKVPQQQQLMWRSCCGQTCTPAAVKYIMQCVFGLLVVMLAGYMLAFTDENESLWASLFSSTVGLFLPHPSPPSVLTPKSSSKSTTPIRK
jgi:hypothetical protein